MPKRIGRHTISLDGNISIKGAASIAGAKEGEGPLSSYFDTVLDDDDWGEATWEKTESKMQKEAVIKAAAYAKLALSDIDYIFGGDLLNQCVGSSYGLRDLEIPFFGLYGACSTMAESLSLASIVVESGCAAHAAAVTSSHFCSAERQFRMPLEYGGQRNPSAQWTVTGSGAAIVSREGNGPYITHITTGKIVDYGIKDVTNMGAAMAPAAVSTLTAHFNETKKQPSDYDLILSGDLGEIGRNIAADMMSEAGYNMDNYNDCGCMIFDLERQDVHAGGSGCGCSAVTLCGYVVKLMREHKLRNVLFMSTGALMSPTTTMQGESIPGIAHAVALSI